MTKSEANSRAKELWGPTGRAFRTSSPDPHKRFFVGYVHDVHGDGHAFITGLGVSYEAAFVVAEFRSIEFKNAANPSKEHDNGG